MYILSACDNSSMLNTILFIKNIIDIIFVVVPIVLVLFFSIDLAKNVFSKNDQDNQRNLQLGIRRIIYSLVLLFVPLLVKTFMGMISDYSKVASCYDIATEAKVKELYDKEEAEYKKQKEENDKKKKENASSVAKEKKQQEKAAKGAKKKAIKEQSKKKESGTSTIDGNFPDKYIQASGIAEAAGGGKNCSDGHKTNCTLGDQSGKEVAVNNWRGGWSYVLRADNPQMANKAAACMEAAAKNKNIGYGQQGFSKWSMLWDYLKKRKDWDVSTVNDKVSVSCCPLVAVCLKYAGFNPTKSLSCWPPASNMKNAVKKAGNFKQVYPGTSLNKSNIRRGDVLVGPHHMAMAV